MDSIPRKYKRALMALGIILLIFGALYLLKNALAPVAVAMVLAYLLDPVIDRMEARKIDRSVAIFILAGLVVVVLGGLLVFFAIQTQRELVSLYHGFPTYFERLEGRMVVMAQNHTGRGVVGGSAGAMTGDPIGAIEGIIGIEIPDTIEQTMEELKRQLAAVDPAALEPITGLLKKLSASTMAFVGWALGLVIIPVFLFYFLRDWDRIKVEAIEYVPHSYRDYVTDKAKKIDEILSAFIRGQLTVCTVLGVLYSLGLIIVGVDLAVVIGMASGLLFIVPYLGTIIGVAAATVMALLKFGIGWQVLGVWAVFGVVQAFEGTLLTPKVMGDKVGLSPVIVIFALLVGSDLLGLLGMLIAVPAAAVIKVFIGEALAAYRKSDFFLETGQGGPKES